MMSLLYNILFPLLGSAEKVVQSATFGWREALSMLGIAMPLLLGAFMYLLRRKQEAENELRKQQIQDIKEAIQRAQKDVDAALDKIEGAVHQHLSHQTACVGKFVDKDVYKQDVEAQSSYVVSMKGTIDTLNQMLMHQQTLVTQLVKTLS